MVFRNSIAPGDGNYQTTMRRPRKFLFDIGAYDVSVHRGPCHSLRVVMWDGPRKIGTLGLDPFYSDVRSIYSVDAKIIQEYQGLGIGYRTYEGLVYEANTSLVTCSQSPGAVKLWRKLAANRYLRVYFVASGAMNLFDSDIYDTVLSDGKIRGVAGNKLFSPYARRGTLLLVKRNGPLDRAIQAHREVRVASAKLKRQFKQHDHQKMIGKHRIGK